MLTFGICTQAEMTKVNVSWSEKQSNSGEINGKWGFPDGSAGKEFKHNAGDLGLIPGLERSPGEGNGYPIQYSCLENPMDRGTWQVVVHWIAKSWTQLSN